MASKHIVTSSLDFDEIKTNLKLYLQGQEEFSDYDFDGSAMSVLLDVLAYNTHYNALYTNLAINEAFLDSAVKRASVVSKAKELGYVPTSAKCAEATVTLACATSGISLPKYTQFSTSSVAGAMSFYTTSEHTLNFVSTNNYQATDVVLRQGMPVRYVYTYSVGTKIRIPSPNVDISTLEVSVQAYNGASSIVYTNADTIVDYDGISQIFFVKELDDQTYELEFGDDNIGKALEVGNIITLEYFITEGAAANGARGFSYAGPNLTSPLFVTTVLSAAGGADVESIESIRWNAPRAYTSQNRCVTIDDYKNIIYSNFADAESINVWGGEMNNPPSYGDVYVSIRPKNNDRLSDSQKAQVLNILSSRKVVTIHPKLVDPTYIHVQVDTTFHYDPYKSTLSSTSLSTNVKNEIRNYATNNLNKFGGIFRFSNLSRVIDDTNAAITNSVTTIKLHRQVIPIYNESTTYTVDIGNPIYNSGAAEDSILSTGFYCYDTPAIVYIDDKPTAGTDTGTLRLFYYNGSNRQYIRSVGTVTYSKGLFEFMDVSITGLATDTFEFIIKPQSNDVASTRNDIVDIPADLITVTAVADRINTPYVLASSRN